MMRHVASRNKDNWRKEVGVRGLTGKRHRKRGTSRIGVLALGVVLALTVVACGDSQDGGGQSSPATQAASCANQTLASPTEATLILDFLPNPVHIAIYQA